VGKISATLVAKWLFPSMTAIIVAIGYVVTAGYDDFLGYPMAESDVPNYINAAAQFFTQTIVALSTDVSWNMLGKIDGCDLWVVVLLLLLNVLVLKFKRSMLADRRKLSWMIAACLALGILGKFYVQDLPITKLSSIGNRHYSASDTDSKMSTLHDASDTIRRHNSLSSTRAADIVAVIESAHHESADSSDHLRAIYFAYSICNVLLAILAIQALLLGGSPSLAALSYLAFAYLLTWPLAYSKIEKSDEYEIGVVYFKKLSDDVDENKPINSKPALILERGQNNLRVLVIKVEPCSDGDLRIAYLREFPNSEVLSIKEIKRANLLTWLETRERECPAPD
jgi:hypothetical protein